MDAVGTCYVHCLYLTCIITLNTIYITVEDWYNHQISNLLQKKTTKTKQKFYFYILIMETSTKDIVDVYVICDEYIAISVFLNMTEG